VGAADELWTRVDPAETGFMFADAATGFPDLADIAAIGPRPDGAVPINIRIDSKHLLRSEDVERLGRAVQGVVLAGRFAQAAVEFEDFGDDGVDLVLGTVADIAGTIDQATIDSVAGPTIAIVPGVRSRRPIVVVTGRSDAELDTAIAKLGVVAPWAARPD
jgi:cellulose synthase operon protein B